MTYWVVLYMVTGSVRCLVTLVIFIGIVLHCYLLHVWSGTAPAPRQPERPVHEDVVAGGGGDADQQEQEVRHRQVQDQQVGRVLHLGVAAHLGGERFTKMDPSPTKYLTPTPPIKYLIRYAGNIRRRCIIVNYLEN